MTAFVSGTRALGTAFVIAMSCVPVQGDPPLGLSDLDGTWAGGGSQIVIDVERSQARRDPTKPFGWEAFRIRNITGNLVVFQIGPSQFIALVESDQMALTGHPFQGAITLRRGRLLGR